MSNLWHKYLTWTQILLPHNTHQIKEEKLLNKGVEVFLIYFIHVCFSVTKFLYIEIQEN